MASREQLAEFIHEGLKQGHPPAQLGEALRAAGWSAREVDAALAAWLPAPAGIAALPVPRPTPYVSARDAVLYGLLFIALGNVIWGVGALGWQVINQVIPDVGDFYDPPRSAMRWSIASLVVFGPVFWWLNGRVMRQTRTDAGQARSLVRKWLASVVVVLATLTLLGDLVTAIYALLNGDLTARFAAKALWVALLAGVVLVYLRDEVDVS
ncbi:hypothetical protein DRW48_00440 [Paracoccus suum]|uniref:DUF5671 domain-containing protein n=1 Tax=Paracoccus suum TaxID=2259340 RepID=A0A344PG69_9RHOB|nr:DUF5671 domain-containing protein [Paracoccus suum]AXC48374.1 hypothetical protein DRW48_00440 [Paracoccus suum]